MGFESKKCSLRSKFQSCLKLAQGPFETFKNYVIQKRGRCQTKKVTKSGTRVWSAVEKIKRERVCLEEKPLNRKIPKPDQRR